MPTAASQNEPSRERAQDRSDATPSALELARREHPEGSTTIVLASRAHHALRWSQAPGEDRLDVVGPDGRVQASIILDNSGPRLVLEHASVEIAAVGDFTVDCGSFEVDARDHLALRGAVASVEARAGDVTIEANDRVRLVAEQIRLNCDGPDGAEPLEREQAAQLIAAFRRHLPRRDTTGDLYDDEEHGSHGD